MNEFKQKDLLQVYRKTLDEKKGVYQHVLNEIEEIKETLKKESKNKRNIEDSLLIAQEVAKQTQQELEYHINEVVSTALASVFPDPYEFKIEFVVRRGKTEADVFFVRNKEKIDPMTASGGGVVDVASFALRIALWNLVKKKINNTIILDEPFKMLSRELQPKAGEMIKLLSSKLGIQFIIVTHNQDIVESADKIFEVTINKKGISEVSS